MKHGTYEVELDRNMFWLSATSLDMLFALYLESSYTSELTVMIAHVQLTQFEAFIIRSKDSGRPPHILHFAGPQRREACRLRDIVLMGLALLCSQSIRLHLPGHDR